jgi:hypothetical protein
MKAQEKKAMMFALVGQWRKSNLSRSAFADQNEISLASFDYWCRKQLNEVVKVQNPTFIEIGQPRVLFTDKSPQVEMEFASGLRLKIY